MAHGDATPMVITELEQPVSPAVGETRELTGADMRALPPAIQGTLLAAHRVGAATKRRPRLSPPARQDGVVDGPIGFTGEDHAAMARAANALLLQPRRSRSRREPQRP
jgi:hypothetical protein